MRFGLLPLGTEPATEPLADHLSPPGASPSARGTSRSEDTAEEFQRVGRDGVGTVIGEEMSRAVDDIAAEHDRLVGLGVTFTQPPTDIGSAVVAVFDDTCGNLIQLITEKRDAGTGD